MQPDDTTSRRVRDMLRDAARAAYDFPRPRPEDSEPECGCGHGRSAHHGPDGDRHCGETGCRCAVFHDPFPAPCPDCTTGTWDETRGRCNGCGLTIEAVAARFAR